MPRSHQSLRTVTLAALALLLVMPAAAAQTPPDPDKPSLPPIPAVGSYCTAVSTGIEHHEVLEQFCEWALSLNERLPNIIGEQTTARYVQIRDRQYYLVDRVTASVSYAHGDVNYANLRVNGKSVNGSIADTGGTLSTGEYGLDIQSLFIVEQSVQLSFLRVDAGRYKGALVFEEAVAQAENRSWQLEFGLGKKRQTLKPGYVVRIWLDPVTARLRHIERETTAVEKTFPLRWVEKRTDYEETPLGDGTSFTLPVECVTFSCDTGKEKGCTLNDLKFSNWRKFGAAHRIMTEPPAGP